MNIFDIIGNFTVAAVEYVSRTVTSLVELVKKKVLNLKATNNRETLVGLKKEFQRRLDDSMAKLPETPQKKSQTTTGSNLFTPVNPVPGQDLLIKEGWTRINVHPVPETGQQVLILKDEKNNKAKMLGKEAFLEYLKELNDKYNR